MNGGRVITCRFCTKPIERDGPDWTSPEGECPSHQKHLPEMCNCGIRGEKHVKGTGFHCKRAAPYSLRPDLGRMIGETNKDAIARLVGQVRALEHERELHAALALRTAAHQARWNITHREGGADDDEYRRFWRGVAVWLEKRAAAIETGEPPDPGYQPEPEPMPTGQAFLDRYSRPGLLSGPD